MWTPPKGLSHTKFGMESQFGAAREIRYGNSKELRKVLGNAHFPQEKRQNLYGTESKTLRQWQNTTDSSTVAFLERKGPLGKMQKMQTPKRRKCGKMLLIGFIVTGFR